MRLLTETKKYIILMKVTLVQFKKVVVMVLLTFLLTRVLVYVMVMLKKEDRADQEGPPNLPQNTAKRSMI